MKMPLMKADRRPMTYSRQPTADMMAKLLSIKLMQLDRHQAKFCLKSDLNLLLIDFFDPIIPATRFTCSDDLIQIRTIIRWKSSILD